MAAPSAEWLCRRIVEAAGDAVLYASRDGRIGYWNAGAEAIFGWTAAEALGQSMDLIVPERLRQRHWEGWNRSMATGATRYSGRELLAVPGQRKDGQPLSVEFTIQLVRDDAGELLGAAAILRDVTARFNRDKELARRLRDLEAQLGRR